MILRIKLATTQSRFKSPDAPDRDRREVVILSARVAAPGGNHHRRLPADGYRRRIVALAPQGDRAHPPHGQPSMEEEHLCGSAC